MSLKEKVILTFIILLPMCAVAQTDTVIISTEVVPENAAIQDKWYNKLFIEKVPQIERDIKLNLTDFLGFNPSIIYERRVGYMSTVQLKLTTDFSGILAGYGYPVIWEYWGVVDEQFLNISLNLNADYRYYFNLKRRERKGKFTYGFSSAYFAFGIHGIWNMNSKVVTIDGVGFTRIQPYSDITRNDKAEVKLIPMDPVMNGRYQEITLKYGIHRRIGNFGYFDLYAGMGVGRSNIQDYIFLKPTAGFEIGFVFSK